MTSTPLPSIRPLRAATLATALLLALAALDPVAAEIPAISNVPLGTTSTTTAKPNIMFILDDSGSMASDYMPDELEDPSTNQVAARVYGALSPQCNGVGYNPSITYAPPIKINADNSLGSYPDVAFGAAPDDGYNSASTVRNLGGTTTVRNVYYTYNTYTGSPAPLSWSYTTAGAVDTSTTFYTECLTARPADFSGNARFTKVTVTSTSDEAQNYANWYSYYRTRQLTMRSAAGRAFAELSTAYRVGFTKISDTTVSGTAFLNPVDFDAGQRALFFNLLYTTPAGSGTPLRGALSKVGRYYGNRISGQTDPVQYSCQRNYAILSTDGYWNGSTRALQLDGTTDVGNQDGTEDPPMKDGTSTIERDTIQTSRIDRRTTTTALTRQTVYERVRSTTTSRIGCNRTATVTQRRTATESATRTLVEDVPITTTTIRENGVTVSGPTDASGGSATTVSNTTSAFTSTSDGTWANVSGTSGGNSCSNPTSTVVSYSPSETGRPGTPTTTSGTPGVSTVAGTPGPATTTTESLTTGGDSNTLADIAEYYWKNDLRSNLEDNVPVSGDDTARHQHMTTFTIGLGLKGTLNYDRNYVTQRSGDFADIRAGAKNWPVPILTVNPRTEANATHIDDLWHAAVNGRGRYFSAADPTQLDDAITSTLSAIRRVTESGAAAAASTLTPVSGDDWVFLPSFTTVTWTGDLRAFKFGFTDTGEVIAPDTSPGTEIWSAGRLLNSRSTARSVLFNNGGRLADFTYANLTAAGRNAAFDNRCSRGTGSENFTQCSSLTTAAAAKVTGANLVAYLAGNTSLYLSAASADDQVFRSRDSLLGDFVNASPVYVGKPPFRYADSGYAAFVSANAGRAKMVYAASNDGMLHAFKVGTGRGDPNGGVEAWAFVPSGVINEMWRLADRDYDHRYYVDATPNVADVFDSTAGRWRTLLVGGLGAGGRGYFALDITDPDRPELLWEFSHADLGYTFGNPVVTKNSAGTWIVAFSSGTNNVNGGDGVGRLYVLDAITGTLIDTVSTATGSGSDPSNLGRINAWVVSDTDNTALRIYAGDSKGNLWRFDHDDRIAPAGKEATLLGRATTPDGAAQPIVGRPVLSEESISNVATPIISFGTGRLLNTTDLGDITLQTLYSVKDSLGATSLGALRSSGANLVAQTLNGSRATPTVTPVDWVTQNGWYLDLTASSKERVYLDGVQLASGVLAFASTVPTADACSTGGQSFLYQIDLRGGQVLGTTTFANMIVGLNRIMSNNGKVSAIVTTQDQKTTLTGSSGGGGGASNTLRRSSWRELTD